jgi:tetratricopeptide (TPR) repeat protein
MKIFNRFLPKQNDLEIQRLQDLAKVTREHPGPHVELAKAYFNRIQTPPEWNKDIAQKGIDSFHKAIQIAGKFTPEQERDVVETMVTTIIQITNNYYTHYQTNNQEIAPIDHLIWLLERTLPEVKNDVNFSHFIRTRLFACWSLIVQSHLSVLENAPDITNALQVLDNALENVNNYSSHLPEVAEIECGVAGLLLSFAEEEADKTDGFPLYDELNKLLEIWNGERRPVQDLEREAAAWKATILMEKGLKYLEKYPESDDYKENAEVSRELYAVITIRHFYLRGAHTKEDDCIPILEKGIQMNDEFPELYYYLGFCYWMRGDRMRRGFSKKAEWLPDTLVIAGGSVTEARAKAVYKKAANYFDRAHELDPGNFEPADELIDMEWLT